MEIGYTDPAGKKKKMEVLVQVPKNFNITVAYMGNITAAVTELHGIKGVGMAVCMPGDKYSKDIGAGLAAARALASIATEMEQAWAERSITKEEWAKKHGKKGAG